MTYDADGNPAHSWRILLLPYLDQNELFKAYRFDEHWDGPNNRKLASRMPSLFAFAGTNETGESTATNFVAITGPETIWPQGSGMVHSDVGDGLSNTIQFAEYNGPTIHWMSPVDLQFASMSFVAGDPAGIDSQYWEPAVAIADGAVKRLSAQVSPAELRAMCTANGNESSIESGHSQEMQDARERSLKPAEGIEESTGK